MADLSNEFLFPDRAPVWAIVFLCLFNVMLIVTQIFVITKIMSRRHHRAISMRSPVTLIIYLVGGLATCIVFSLSIILGKPAFCTAQDVMYIILPVVSLQINMTFPDLVFAAQANDLKVLHSEGNLAARKSLAFRIKRAFSLPMRLLYISLDGMCQVAIFFVIKTYVSLPGDCNRNAQLSFIINMAIVIITLGYFLKRVRAVNDPYFIRIGSDIGFLCAGAQIILAFMYPIAPSIFPPWFDYRWNMTLFAPVATFLDGLFPVLLTDDAFRLRLERWGGTMPTEMLQEEADKQGSLFALKRGVNMLEAVLHDPILVASFRDFATSRWSVENVLFYVAVDDFKLLCKADAGQCPIFAAYLANEYLLPGAPLEVNLDHDIRSAVLEELNENLAETTFDAAQAHIYALMERDTFVEWRRTAAFSEALAEALLQRQSSDSHPGSRPSRSGSDLIVEMHLEAH